MVYAAVSLCPVPGGTLKSYDASKVMDRRGIQAVVPVPGGVAVVADRFWRAKQAAADLPVEWNPGAGAGTDSAKFRADYRAALDGKLAMARDDGDTPQALTQGKLVEATYEVPHLSHAPMEPLNCTAHVHANGVDVWLGTQNPDMALQLAAKAAGVAPEKVQVHTCFLGGGFGRRSMNDELVQAVTVAKAVGKPVKLRVDARDRHAPRPLSAASGAAHPGQPGGRWRNERAAYPDRSRIDHPLAGVGHGGRRGRAASRRGTCQPAICGGQPARRVRAEKHPHTRDVLAQRRQLAERFRDRKLHR